MSSVFRARRTTETETGVGGKIVRRQRHAAAESHPYLRPKSPLPFESPSWISGFLSPAARTIAVGAGKLLSSVFGSSQEDHSSSSSSGDDDEDDDYSDDDNVCSEDVEKLNQNGTTPVSTKDHPLDTQPTTQKSEAKRTIERLLLQETFTRDECTELMKIIQSRLVDCPTMNVGEDAAQKKLYGRTFGNDITFPGAWRSSSQSRKSPEAYPYSANGLSDLSPCASALQVHTPNLCNTAIMEAKKWLEEKKLESSSNAERDHGSCLLSNDAVRHVIEGDVASPLDMAKSYMRSRTPWASPSLSNIEFKTPPPIGIHHHINESSDLMAHYSLPSTKDLEEAQTTKELVSCDLASHEYLVPVSISMQHNGADLSADLLNSKPEVMPSERGKCMLTSDADGVANHNSTHASTPQISSQAGKTLPAENHVLSGLEESDSLPGSTLEGEGQMQTEANGPGNNDDASGFLPSQTSSMALNAEPGLRTSDEIAQNSTSSGHGELASSDHGKLAVDKPMENFELYSEVSMEAPATNETNTGSDGLQNATNRTMDEEPQVQPQKRSSARVAMRGKKVGYSQRGRGRGKR